MLELIESDKLYVHGKYRKLPRYYLKVLERNGYDLSKLLEQRKENSEVDLSSHADLEAKMLHDLLH